MRSLSHQLRSCERDPVGGRANDSRTDYRSGGLSAHGRAFPKIDGVRSVDMSEYTANLYSAELNLARARLGELNSVVQPNSALGGGCTRRYRGNAHKQTALLKIRRAI